METRGRRVVILGSSLGGLLAARALSHRFGRVTLVERDRFPAGFEQRKGVPQGRHTHGLLSSGYRVIEEFFPGIGGELVECGALLGDAMWDSRYVIGGQLLRKASSQLCSIGVNRPLLEGQVRRRSLALPNVEAVEDCDVLGLDGDAGRIRGVRILRRADKSAEEHLDADLVVDATGRGSRMPAWLTSLGLEAPEEERVRVGVSYTTGIFPRREDQVGGDRVLIVGAAPPNRHCGVAVAFERDRWIVTLASYLGEHVPSDPAGFAASARRLPSPIIHELVRDQNPLEPLVTAKFPHSQRRRYERLARFPEGLLVFGDALCSFNPIYGQGMSVAALEAKLLRGLVQTGGSVWQRFFSGAASIIDNPWAITVGNDLRFEEVEGARTRAWQWTNAYMRRLLNAATVDATVATAFISVTHLVAPPASLFAPGIVARVLRAGSSRAATAPLVAPGAAGYVRELDAE